MVNTRKLPLTERAPSHFSPASIALIDRVHTFLQHEGLSTVKLCVGLSGGLDSVVLLHILAQLSCRLSAVHVHHGLSPNATAWSQFAQSFSASLSVPCEVCRVSVDRKSGEGLEAAARRARYAVYAAQPCDAIALAHHQNDQAETMLLQLVRGSGVRGLAGMPLCRPLHDSIRLIRPLLDMPRATLQAYAIQHGLQWVEDESNTDTHYRRNFLRHAIIPQLEIHYPRIIATLASATQHFAAASTLLRDLALLDFPELEQSRALPQETMMSLSDTRQRNLLYWYLLACGVEPTDTIITELMRLVVEAGRDSQPQIQVHWHRIYLDRQCITVVPAFVPPDQAMTLSWQGETQLDVPAWRATLHLQPDTEGLSLTYLQQGLTLMPRQSGATLLRIHPDRPRQPVKYLWQQHQIPTWQRQYFPFVYCGQALIWVPYAGMVTDPSPDGAKFRLTWQPWDFSPASLGACLDKASG